VLGIGFGLWFGLRLGLGLLCRTDDWGLRFSADRRISCRAAEFCLMWIFMVPWKRRLAAECRGSKCVSGCTFRTERISGPCLTVDTLMLVVCVKVCVCVHGCMCDSMVGL